MKSYYAAKAPERKISAGTVTIRTNSAENDTWDEPPELAAALDGLGHIGHDF